MKRRNALKGLSALTIGITLFPSCNDGLTLNISEGKIAPFSKNQGIWINSISEAILPKGEDVITTYEPFPDYVFKMIHFDHSKKDQGSFFNGYNVCTREIKNLFDSKTDEISEEQIVDYFTSILKKEKINTVELTELEQQNKSDQILFCETLRAMAIKHYTTSKEYQEQVLEYKLVPESYQSCSEV